MSNSTALTKSLTVPLLITLFLHGLILAVILIEAPDSSPLVKRAVTKYIKAELVTLDKVKAKKPVKPKKKPKPKDDSKAKKQALAKKKALVKKRTEQKKAKQRQLLKNQQLAKQKKIEQKKQQQLAAQQEQQRLKEQADQEFADAIEQENALIAAETDTQLANSYIALITDVIQRNWNRPPSARNSMETELALQLLPTGEVVSVNVVKSSGNSAFDRSAENAVLKAGRFPEIQQMPSRVFERHFRRLNLKFKPEDLRL